MDGWHPARAELPGEFPVFPLTGALLLPHGKLPLNIFEPRYKALVEDALADQRMFGMIQPDAAQQRPNRGQGCWASAASGACPRSARRMMAATSSH